MTMGGSNSSVQGVLAKPFLRSILAAKSTLVGESELLPYVLHSWCLAVSFCQQYYTCNCGRGKEAVSQLRDRFEVSEREVIRVLKECAVSPEGFAIAVKYAPNWIDEANSQAVRYGLTRRYRAILATYLGVAGVPGAWLLDTYGSLPFATLARTMIGTDLQSISLLASQLYLKGYESTPYESILYVSGSWRYPHPDEFASRVLGLAELNKQFYEAELSAGR